MNKKQLKDAFDEGLINEEKYGEELVKLEMAPKPQRKQKKLPVSITREEFFLLMKKTKKDIFKVAFLLAFGAGLRLSEIAGGTRTDGSPMKPLTKENIEFDRKRIRIEDAKGRKDRITSIPKGFKQSMLKFLPITKAYKNYASCRRSLQRGFKVAARKAKLLETKPTLHFHSLRSGFGSRLAEQGAPIHMIRDMMGHSSISTTNVYLISNPVDNLEKYEELF